MNNNKKTIWVEFEVKELSAMNGNLYEGDFVEYRGEIYKFHGWEYGHDAILTSVKTGKSVRVTF